MAPTSNSSTILLVIILEGYGCVALSIWVLCPVPAELSVCLPASNLVVPISVAAQGTHDGTYIVSHIVDHNTPRLLQASGVLPLPEGPFLHIKYLGEIVLDFQMLLISYCI